MSSGAGRGGGKRGPRDGEDGLGDGEDGPGVADGGGVADRGDDPAAPPRPGDAPAASCELCGGPVLERHCRIICLNCGFQRDCSDP